MPKQEIEVVQKERSYEDLENLLYKIVRNDMDYRQRREKEFRLFKKITRKYLSDEDYQKISEEYNVRVTALRSEWQARKKEHDEFMKQKGFKGF